MDESKVRDAQNPAEKMPEQDKESASTSFETHSPSAISSGWDESSRGQGKLVFAPPQRGLPSLNRGYRTPDPSPSHLPKCGALELMIGAEDGLSDAPGSPRNYGTPRRRIETEPWNMEEEREVPASPGLSRIRTPSPLLDRSCVASVPPPPALLCAPGYSVGAMWPVFTVHTCPASLSSWWSGVEWVAASPPNWHLQEAPLDIPTVVMRLANIAGKSVDARTAGIVIIATSANGDGRLALCQVLVCMWHQDEVTNCQVVWRSLHNEQIINEKALGLNVQQWPR